MKSLLEPKTVRDRIEADLLQQVGNEIEDTLILFAPTHWQYETCEEIERQVLDQTRTELLAQTDAQLQSRGALRRHINNAVRTTKRLCWLDRETIHAE